jgi:hypothetical protein
LIGVAPLDEVGPVLSDGGPARRQICRQINHCAGSRRISAGPVALIERVPLTHATRAEAARTRTVRRPSFLAALGGGDAGAVVAGGSRAHLVAELDEGEEGQN